MTLLNAPKAAQDRRVDADYQTRFLLISMKNLFLVFKPLLVLLFVATVGVALANDPAPAKPAADAQGSPPKKEEKKPVEKEKGRPTPLKDKNRAKELLLEEFKLGLITKKEYRVKVQKIEDMYGKGGKVD